MFYSCMFCFYNRYIIFISPLFVFATFKNCSETSFNCSDVGCLLKMYKANLISYGLTTSLLSLLDTSLSLSLLSYNSFIVIVGYFLIIIIFLLKIFKGEPYLFSLVPVIL